MWLDGLGENVVPAVATPAARTIRANVAHSEQQRQSDNYASSNNNSINADSNANNNSGNSARGNGWGGSTCGGLGRGGNRPPCGPVICFLSKQEGHRVSSCPELAVRNKVWEEHLAKQVHAKSAQAHVTHN